MNTITKLVVLVSLCLICGKANAQDTIKKNENIIKVKDLKESIEKEEKEFLKAEVEAINKRLEEGQITKEESERLKQEAAKKHALNIENRWIIAENKVALLSRNDQHYNEETENSSQISISVGSITGIKIRSKNTPPKYDIRTTNKLLFAVGLNNTIIDGQSLDDSPYEIGGSSFAELGWIWHTRLLKESNFTRFTYGLSFQWNKLSVKDNLYFVEDGNQTSLEEFPLDLKKSKFRTTSLVIPLHFEFGPSKKKDYDNRIRYFTDDQFKIGIGGFAGLNLSTQQKLKYKEDGDDKKQKIKSDFNTTNVIYGFSGYIGVGDFSIYAKYNLNDLFKNQTVKQNHVSLGLRWDLD